VRVAVEVIPSGSSSAKPEVRGASKGGFYFWIVAKTNNTTTEVSDSTDNFSIAWSVVGVVGDAATCAYHRGYEPKLASRLRFGSM
jgi:hypothetical protein